MTRTKSRKAVKAAATKSQRPTKKPKNLPPKAAPKPAPKNTIHDEDPILFGSDSESEPTSESEPETPSSPTRIHALLEPYTKDQLISFLADAALSDPSVLTRIRSAAESDVNHRKLFVHGLGWDAVKETLVEAFSRFGAVEDCHVVLDRATGRAKGFGFVTFRTRSAARKALREPQKWIKNRLINCQLACMGAPAAASASASTEGRRVYVGQVFADAQPDKLKEFFSKFGEIEAGPFGYDMATGKSRGFAIFTYKDQEGAKKALEEPYKVFQGHQLHCRLATDASQKGKVQLLQQPTVGVTQQQAVAAMSGFPGPPSQPVLAAVAAAQNLALMGQNPAYNAFLAQNPLLAAAAWNQAAAFPQGYGGVGMGSVTPSALGSYGSGGLGASTGVAGSQGMQGYQGLQLGMGAAQSQGMQGYQGLQLGMGVAGSQGMQGYQGLQLGQTSSVKPGGVGGFGGFPSSSYMDTKETSVKGNTSESSTKCTANANKDQSGDGQSLAKWDDFAHLKFIELCEKEIAKRNRPRSRLTADGWKNLARQFNDMTGRDYTYGQIKRHWDCMKSDWILVKQLITGETRLRWDETKQTLMAKDKWWEDKIKENIKYKKFRNRNLSLIRFRYDALFADIVNIGESA